MHIVIAARVTAIPRRSTNLACNSAAMGPSRRVRLARVPLFLVYTHPKHRYCTVLDTPAAPRRSASVGFTASASPLSKL